MSANDAILESIRERLVQELKPSKIYLWGSRARGDHKADSDYDLVIVLENSDKTMFERNALARRALSEVDAAVDVFVYTQSEFNELKDDFSSIPETVLFEGRELALD